jgi:hypothetical protein
VIYKMREIESDIPKADDTLEPATGGGKIRSPAVPKPVFMRMVLLFGGGVGCLFVGIVVARATGDFVTLGMSVILCAALATKGVLLKRKIKSGVIFCVSGVCVSIAPKLLGRYRRIELVNTDTGGDAHFVLPKKTVFKVGHVYNCYFDTPPATINDNDGPRGRFSISESDLPTNGFLGFEDFGVYQEKPAATADKNNMEDETT